MALLYDKVVSIVSKDPDSRTSIEIDQILPWFRKKSELFKSQKAEIVKDILKNCQFMKCMKDHVIIKQGDKGDCFFIILSGTVAIYIQNNIPEDGIQYDPTLYQEDKTGKRKQLDRSIFGFTVGKIPAGRSFGELALINADCVRNASIIADEVTDLIIVNRELYDRSLKAFQEKEFNEKKRFVEEYYLFQGWTNKYKKQLAMSLRKEKVCFDDIIIKQGYPIDGLCFLLTGQAKVLVDPIQHEIQYPQRFPLPDIAELQKVEARESIRREMNMAVHRSEEKRHIYHRPRSPNISDRKRQHKTTELCVIGAIELIGDLEMEFGLSSYAQTTQCTEAAEVFILDQSNYERLIEKRNPQSLDLMRDSLHEKLALRMSWAQDANLPLLKYFLYKLDERKRHEMLRQRDYSRKRDIRETIDYWRSGKLHHGPLIDQFGPGSVFYTIRMRAKSRRGLQRSKTAGPNFGITSMAVSRNHSGAYLSHRADVNMKGSNFSLNKHGGGGGAVHTMKMVKCKTAKNNNYTDGDSDDDEEDDDDVMSDNDMDVDMYDGRQDRSTILCEQKNTGRKSERNNKVRSSCSVDEFMNQELNDLTLSRLETKIEEWHSRVNKLEDDGLSSRLDKKHLVKLHRYNADENKKPLPGTKIILRPRAPPKATPLSRHLEAMDLKNQNLSRPSSADRASLRSRDTSDEQIESRDTWNNNNTEFDYQKCIVKRPQSSNIILSDRTPVQMKRRPKSARNYTIEDYTILKEELRRKQIAYKSLFMRSTTCFI
ncbi:hypothetical protein ACF0H5_016418 [Mactra antiquata]